MSPEQKQTIIDFLREHPEVPYVKAAAKFSLSFQYIALIAQQAGIRRKRGPKAPVATSEVQNG